MTYEFNTGLEVEENGSNNNSSNSWLIALIFIMIFIIICFIFFVNYRKIRLRNRNLEDKVNAISLSSGINEDLNNKFDLENKKINEDYENVFI